MCMCSVSLRFGWSVGCLVRSSLSQWDSLLCLPLDGLSLCPSVSKMVSQLSVSQSVGQSVGQSDSLSDKHIGGQTDRQSVRATDRQART